MAKKFPALRAAIAREMASQGITQEQIAKMLKVSQGAVSQYVSSQRGKDLFVAGMMNHIREISKRMLADKTDIDKEICAFCKKLEDI